MTRLALPSLVSSSLHRGALIAGALLLAALPAGSAQAATWGSFDSSRMAYVTGPLEGTAHGMLRGIIVAEGHDVAPATSQLTPEYLGTVDVFYTAMLSDGTGPTAGAVGTLSFDERAALQAWIADGGTLIVTPDSNGFGGPFPIVYDSWLSDYGVTDFMWVFSFAVGNPVVVHPITQGIGDLSLDGYCTFTYPGDAEILATVDNGLEPLIVVLEPATGFTAGGRILVVSDHNALTDTYIVELDNYPLAENIVRWAAGECGNGIVESDEECDDGNRQDGDGCSSMCVAGGGDSSGGGDSTGGGDTSASTSTSGGGTSGGETGVEGTTTLPGDDAGSTQGFEDTGSGEESSTGELPPSDDGCSCRGGGGSGALAGVPLLLALGLRRRRGR